MMDTNIEKQIIDSAQSHGGLVTALDMKQRGVSPDTLLHWARRHGKYSKLGRGIYSFDDLNARENIDTADQKWFLPLALAHDSKAYLHGITVLMFFNLGYAAANYGLVRAGTTYKHDAGYGVIVEPYKKIDRVDTLRGIRIQTLVQAFAEARPMRADYLRDAIEESYDRNLINETEYDKLVHDWKHKYGKYVG